ncbi:hypothetical protein [Thalassospira xiamenensis]|jgi:hypothetical protein|uniref:Uncharacterized protein n=1 Tax=Thalassospira xiamenensis TaxID=220697 RepID=A0A367XHN4_9PROT|nr:hypothetical protein [Thalassospira xiamenensis]KZB51070.1 hypothetical protein AUP41_08165 [Thalassospira xiamenensis]MCK2167780.1 hypothetical protein [Thalassospira xiamenensis]RCK53157.1 hypothetical protein TH44_02850 [Thalassospira xiamenensis]
MNKQEWKQDSRYGMSHPHKDVVDVEHYRFDNVKMGFGIIAIATFLAMFWFVWNNGDMNLNKVKVWGYELSHFDRLTRDFGYVGYGYLWGEHPSWQHTYQQRCLVDNWYGCTSETTPWEFTQMMFARGWDKLVLILYVILLVTVYQFAYFFLRKPAPVRFNRALGAIYTWRRGQLWILPERNFDFTFKTEIDIASYRSDSGPMRIKLCRASNPNKTRSFSLGSYRNQLAYYGEYFGRDLRRFMTSVDGVDFTSVPLRHSYLWWQWSIFGKRDLPDDIDQRAADWIKQQSIEIPPPGDKAEWEAREVRKAQQAAEEEEAEEARQSALSAARRLFRKRQ